MVTEMTESEAVLAEHGGHKATPQDADAAVSTCVHCLTEVHVVPGGRGPVFVHDDGYVVRFRPKESQ